MTDRTPARPHCPTWMPGRSIIGGIFVCPWRSWQTDDGFRRWPVCTHKPFDGHQCPEGHPAEPTVLHGPLTLAESEAWRSRLTGHRGNSLHQAVLTAAILGAQR